MLHFIFYLLLTMGKFKTSEEGIKFFEDFICPLFWKARQMSDYYYNKLDKLGELTCGEWKHKEKNNLIWDMFSDWEDVLVRIDCDLRFCRGTEEEKLDYLNSMLEEYEWYLQW